MFSRLAISLVLVLQVIPLLLFTPQTYASGSQEWWLPAMLTLMAIIAVINLFVRGNASWPWLLISFVQGFNIISRLMMLWAQGSDVASGTTTLDLGYILTALVAMILSGVMLWYTEKPAVREGLLRT